MISRYIVLLQNDDFKLKNDSRAYEKTFYMALFNEQ